MKLFEKNVGTIDRSVRLGLGVGLVIGGLKVMDAPLSYVAVVVGLLLLFTGFMSTCTLYSLLGVNTLGKKEAAPLAPKAKKRK